MLELAGHALLDKVALIGACSRLALRFDAARLAAEIDELPAECWGTAGGRVGVHRVAQSVFLRGYAPAQGHLPIEDRPMLAHLPYTRDIIEAQIPAPPMRCLLARLPGGASIAAHLDRAPYFAQTIRLHVAVTSHDRAFMLCAGQCYVMQPGELWALNNNTTHGVWNADETLSRTHLICDFLPTPALLSLLAQGERGLGQRRADIESRLSDLTQRSPALRPAVSMIATNRFVFLHLHKSGGSFVNECLLRFVPSARTIGYHLPRMLIPADYLNLPVLGFVRNPWSYYVSWYSFQAQRPRPNALFKILSDNARLDFAGTVRNMLELGSGSARLDAVIAALPASYGNSGLNLPNYALAPIRNSGLGFYSYLYRYLYGEPDGKLTVERADQLRDRFLDYLERIGHRMTEAMQDFVRDTPPRNISAHGPYVDFYTDELRDLVAERDGLIIARHGYRFGD